MIHDEGVFLRPLDTQSQNGTKNTKSLGRDNMPDIGTTDFADRIEPIMYQSCCKYLCFLYILALTDLPYRCNVKIAMRDY